MTYLWLEKVKCEKMIFHYWKDWVNITVSIYSDRISAVISSAQQYYSECASHYYYADILSADLS